MIISVVISGVMQRTAILPRESTVDLGFPGLSSKTKRFSNVARAAGVRRENAAAFRAVNVRAKSALLWEHAAIITELSAVAGSPFAWAWAIHFVEPNKFNNSPRIPNTHNRLSHEIRKSIPSVLCDLQNCG